MVFISIITVALITIFLRVFEYAFNKPTRETIFSHLEKMIGINQLFLLILLFQDLAT